MVPKREAAGAIVLLKLAHDVYRRVQRTRSGSPQAVAATPPPTPAPAVGGARFETLRDELARELDRLAARS